MTLCYAITSHKSQGQTLEQVIIDFTNAKGGIAAGSFYVAMSRVRLGENLYLRGFEENYIQANPLVERQLNAMKISSPYNFKKIYMEKEIYEKIGHELKIAYININSLYEGKSHIFLNNDENLLQLDFLLVADTRLTSHNSQEELEERLENWRMIRRFDADDGFRHMGLLLLQSKSSNMKNLQIETAKKFWKKKINNENRCFAQLLTVILPQIELEMAFLYIRATPTMGDTERIAKDIANADLVMGDLNLDPMKTDGEDLG